MSRPASIVRHDDIVRADKALSKTGASIGRLIIFRDRVEIVPNYGDSVDSAGEVIDPTPDEVAELPEPKLCAKYGWSDPKEARPYIREANKRRLIDNATERERAANVIRMR